jgi:hypothetical protein
LYRAPLIFGFAYSFAVVALMTDNAGLSRDSGSRPGRIMANYTPRHARQPRKRHRLVGLDVNLVMTALGLLLTLISTLAALGIIGSSAGRAVVAAEPAPVTYRYGGHQPVTCPPVQDPRSSPQ